MRTKLRFMIVLVAIAMGAAACGDDDGDAVRETGAASGSGSASASGASGSGAASGSHAASGAEECHVEDGVDGEATGEVHAELTEYAIELAEESVKAGKIKFEAENAGAEDHEIAIIRSDDVTELPLTADGAVDDAAVGDALIGEIEPFASETACEGTFELAAGNYAIICNIVEEEEGGEKEAHFKEGMYTTLTVTA